MLAFWGALALGVALLVRWVVGGDVRPSGDGPESALDVLKRRYAAGELTREQYEQTRADLER
jgi:putative membrane protein